MSSSLDAAALSNPCKKKARLDEAATNAPASLLALCNADLVKRAHSMKPEEMKLILETIPRDGAVPPETLEVITQFALKKINKWKPKKCIEFLLSVHTQESCTVLTAACTKTMANRLFLFLQDPTWNGLSTTVRNDIMKQVKAHFPVGARSNLLQTCAVGAHLKAGQVCQDCWEPIVKYHCQGPGSAQDCNPYGMGSYGDDDDANCRLCCFEPIGGCGEKSAPVGKEACTLSFAGCHSSCGCGFSCEGCSIHCHNCEASVHELGMDPDHGDQFSSLRVDRLCHCMDCIGPGDFLLAYSCDDFGNNWPCSLDSEDTEFFCSICSGKEKLLCKDCHQVQAPFPISREDMNHVLSCFEGLGECICKGAPDIYEVDDGPQ